MNDSDLLVFSEEDEIAEIPTLTQESWKILVVDDDVEVHAVTKLALSTSTAFDRPLEFISAMTALDAQQQLFAHPDIAVILLDVVMESEYAGLEFADYVRNELKNSTVRIILRTGQPGQAPESEVIIRYDINDYKEKTELTTQKLYTSVYTALRTYQNLCTLEESRVGLLKVLDATANIFEMQSIEGFAQGVLEQASALLFNHLNITYLNNAGIASSATDHTQRILASTDHTQALIGKDPRKVLSADINTCIQETLKNKKTTISDDLFMGYVCTPSGTEAVIYIKSDVPINHMDRSLLEIFFRNVTLGMENIYLRQDIESSQQELVYMLANAVETRSNETGNHVKRVGEYSYQMAILLGMDENEAEIIRNAAPLHDIGKIGIPDSILNKPARLTPEERTEMESHAVQGGQLLGTSERKLLQAASIIASQHHERWDGTGYPKQMAGEDIHIYGRIVCLTDIFDALLSKRCYKPAWNKFQVIEYIKSESGRLFDPNLVLLLIDNIDIFFRIRARYPDKD